MPNDTGTALVTTHAYQPPGWLMPTSFEAIETLALKICLAGWVPKAYVGRDGKPNQAMVEVAIMHGLEVGLRPMAALQGIAVINGTPTLWGDAMLALVEQSGLMTDFEERFEGEGDDLAAVCMVSRLNRSTALSTRFSIAMAKRAQLWGKAGPWTQYPSRMLTMRARSWALRGRFADVLKGLHSAEEMLDGGEDQPAAPAEPRPTRSRPPKANQQATDAAFREVPAAAQHQAEPSIGAAPEPEAGALDTAPADAEQHEDEFALVDPDTGQIDGIRGADAFADAFLKMLEGGDLDAVWSANPNVLGMLTDAGRQDLARVVSRTDAKLQGARAKAPSPADAGPVAAEEPLPTPRQHAEFFARKTYVVRVDKNGQGGEDITGWADTMAMLFGETESVAEVNKLHADNIETAKRIATSYKKLAEQYEKSRKAAIVRCGGSV